MDYRVVRCKDAYLHMEAQSEVSNGLWERYMSQGPVLNAYWDFLYELFPEFQFFLKEEDQVAGLGNCLPLLWEGPFSELPEEGWDWALEKGIRDRQEGKKPNVLNGAQVLVAGNHQGRGVSYLVIQEMKALARQHDLEHIIIAVRPTWKSRYPLTPITRYIIWTREDGLPYDPWLRTHVRSGGSIIKPCHKAMYIPGTIAQWEEWTKMRFFESGEYIIPGALTPVTMDLERDLGVYSEPNVWVAYHVND